MSQIKPHYLFSLLALAVMTESAYAYSWNATRLSDANNPRAFQAADLNNARQVVGTVTGSDGTQRAYLYENGVGREIGSLASGRSSSATGINNAGQIIGWAETGEPNEYGQPRYAYLYQNGSATQLDGMGSPTAISDSGLVTGTAAGSRATIYDSNTRQTLWLGPANTNDNDSIGAAINNAGQVVGVMNDYIGDDGHAFLHDLASDSTLRLNPGRYSFSVSEAINESGQVVGYGHDAIGRRGAFYYHDGVSISYINPFYGLSSTASDINESGQIGGALQLEDYDGYSGLWHAFLYDHGQLFDLNDGLALGNGDYLEEVIAINDGVDILARSALGHTYLLENTYGTLAAVPEPESWAMLVAGLGLSAWSCRRRKDRESAAAAR